jgi:divalent metal cation (Fe/Co/Zn/Cd) transporter
MFDGISTREIIIFGIIICLIIFAIYLFTETRSLRATLDSMDEEEEEEIGEEGSKEESQVISNGPGNP